MFECVDVDDCAGNPCGQGRCGRGRPGVPRACRGGWGGHGAPWSSAGAQPCDPTRACTASAARIHIRRRVRVRLRRGYGGRNCDLGVACSTPPPPRRRVVVPTAAATRARLATRATPEACSAEPTTRVPAQRDLGRRCAHVRGRRRLRVSALHGARAVQRRRGRGGPAAPPEHSARRRAWAQPQPRVVGRAERGVQHRGGRGGAAARHPTTVRGERGRARAPAARGVDAARRPRPLPAPVRPLPRALRVARRPLRIRAAAGCALDPCAHGDIEDASNAGGYLCACEAAERRQLRGPHNAALWTPPRRRRSATHAGRFPSRATYACREGYGLVGAAAGPAGPRARVGRSTRAGRRPRSRRATERARIWRFGLRCRCAPGGSAFRARSRRRAAARPGPARTACARPTPRRSRLPVRVRRRLGRRRLRRGRGVPSFRATRGGTVQVDNGGRFPSTALYAAVWGCDAKLGCRDRRRAGDVSCDEYCAGGLNGEALVGSTRAGRRGQKLWTRRRRAAAGKGVPRRAASRVGSEPGRRGAGGGVDRRNVRKFRKFWRRPPASAPIRPTDGRPARSSTAVSSSAAGSTPRWAAWACEAECDDAACAGFSRTAGRESVLPHLRRQ